MYFFTGNITFDQEKCKNANGYVKKMIKIKSLPLKHKFWWKNMEKCKWVYEKSDKNWILEEIVLTYCP